MRRGRSFKCEDSSRPSDSEMETKSEGRKCPGNSIVQKKLSAAGAAKSPSPGTVAATAAILVAKGKDKPTKTRSESRKTGKKDECSNGARGSGPSKSSPEPGQGRPSSSRLVLQFGVAGENLDTPAVPRMEKEVDRIPKLKQEPQIPVAVDGKDSGPVNDGQYEYDADVVAQANEQAAAIQRAEVLKEEPIGMHAVRVLTVLPAVEPGARPKSYVVEWEIDEGFDVDVDGPPDEAIYTIYPDAFLQKPEHQQLLIQFYQEHLQNVECEPNSN